MFNYQKVKNLKGELQNSLDRVTYRDQTIHELNRVISRAVRVFKLGCHRHASASQFVKSLQKRDSTLLTEYLDFLDREKAEQIQDDILREKVEKIVLALREHKWEPA